MTTLILFWFCYDDTLARLTETFGPHPVTGSPCEDVPIGKALWLFYVPAGE